MGDDPLGRCPKLLIQYRVELGYYVMKVTDCFVSLLTGVVITKECNVVVKSEELIGTTEYLTLQARCRINRCRYN
jgi:hypothetical protein